MKVLRIAVIIASVLVGACAVSTNDEPVAVGPVFDDFLEPTTTTTTTTPETATKVVPVYFLRSVDNEVEVVAVERSVAVDAGPQQILTNLFKVRPDGQERPDEAGLSTAIPQTAELISAEIVSGNDLLVVDTRGLFSPDGVIGNELRNALAQIVWTATEIDGVRRIQFQNDGELFNAIIGNGEQAEGAVTRQQYRQLG